jgi:hypothetical protein
MKTFAEYWDSYHKEVVMEVNPYADAETLESIRVDFYAGAAAALCGAVTLGDTRMLPEIEGWLNEHVV